MIDFRDRPLLLKGTSPLAMLCLPLFLVSFFFLVGFAVLLAFLPAFRLTVVFGLEPGRNITVRLSSALSAGVP